MLSCVSADPHDSGGHQEVVSQRGTAKRKLLSFPKTPFQELMWILTMFATNLGGGSFASLCPPPWC